MTLRELKALVKDGAAWAQVENFIVQEIDAAKRANFIEVKDAKETEILKIEELKKKELEANQAELDALKTENARLNAVLTAAREAFDKGDVTAMQELRRKVDMPKKERRRAELDAEIQARKAERDALGE